MAATGSLNYRHKSRPGKHAIEGGVADRVRYDFKDIVEARRGYQLERTVFADGSAWELPSPL